MRAIDECKQLITNFPNIDKVYLYAIPKDELDTVDETQCLLREVQMFTGENGNNNFNSYSTEIEIQIFFKLNIDFDTEQFQVKLLQLFQQNDYEVYTFGGMVEDPQTKQLTSTIYVQSWKLINKEEQQ